MKRAGGADASPPRGARPPRRPPPTVVAGSRTTRRSRRSCRPTAVPLTTVSTHNVLRNYPRSRFPPTARPRYPTEAAPTPLPLARTVAAPRKPLSPTPTPTPTRTTSRCRPGRRPWTPASRPPTRTWRNTSPCAPTAAPRTRRRRTTTTEPPRSGSVRRRNGPAPTARRAPPSSWKWWAICPTPTVRPPNTSCSCANSIRSPPAKT
mmetsp:Transcript_46203/g.90238  ORF Transcript_46203/g.90238 Transcript_46203/m.90238 type:complete len:206 (-) Transcript_46203:335-952(-)